MVTITSGKWIADLGAMTCRNINTKMIVEFKKKEKTYIGKIRDMPLELLERWAKLKHDEMRIQRAVMEAEEVFLRAYIENDIERKEKALNRKGGIASAF